MGLDSYVYRIKKAPAMEKKIYKVEELQEMGFEVIRKGDMDHTVDQLLPYCTMVIASAAWYDIAGICRDNHLSQKSYLSGRAANGDITVVDPEKNGKNAVTVTAQAIAENYTTVVDEPYYIFECKRVAYWRKNYDVQNFFYMNLEHVENTGFYLLDGELLTDFNAASQGRWGYLPVEEPTEKSGLFYHEWF